MVKGKRTIKCTGCGINFTQSSQSFPQTPSRGFGLMAAFPRLASTLQVHAQIERSTYLLDFVLGRYSFCGRALIAKLHRTKKNLNKLGRSDLLKNYLSPSSLKGFFHVGRGFPDQLSRGALEEHSPGLLENGLPILHTLSKQDDRRTDEQLGGKLELVKR